MSVDCMCLAKSGTCPISRISVSLFGTYEKDSEGRLALSEVHCAIIDNLKKPINEQDKELAVEGCENSAECPLYSGFSAFA